MKTKLTPKKILDTLTIEKYITDSVVETMPTKKSKEKIELFNVGKYITNSELIKEYETRGLTLAFPADLIEAYKDSQPKDFIATVWDYKDDTTSYIAFARWCDGKRRVFVDPRGNGWRGFWWFAGVRKSSKLGKSELSEPMSLDLAIKICKENGLEVYKKY